MGRQDIAKTGIRFSSENQPKNRGRKKDIFKQFKNTEVSRNDIKNIIKFLMTKDLFEIKELAENDELIKGQVSPVSTFANIMYKAYHTGDLKTYQEVIDFALGKSGDIIWK